VEHYPRAGLDPGRRPGPQEKSDRMVR